MTGWQIILLAWAVGAFAAFPSIFEFYNELDENDPERLPRWTNAAIAVLAAALWPLAWLLLIAHTAMRAAR